MNSNTSNNLRVCYFGIYNSEFSRNKVYISALRLKGCEIIECQTTKTGFSRYVDLFKKHWDIRNTYDVLIVGYPGYIVSLFARLISSKIVIFDALCLRYDSDIVSRNAHEGSFFKQLFIECIDWLACIAADIILVETNEQKLFTENRYKLSSDAVEVMYTGVDESRFKKNVTVAKEKNFTVLFRGRIMSEAGVPILIEAAKILEHQPIQFKVIGFGWGEAIAQAKSVYEKYKLPNLTWIQKELPFDELLKHLQSSHVSLGQFGHSKRLDRTIPHKAFESMILGVPYITARSKGIAEIYTDRKHCLMVDDAQSLASAIMQLKEDPDFASLLAANAETLYWESFSWQVLGNTLVKIISPTKPTFLRLRVLGRGVRSIFRISAALFH